ncbi:MAG: xanthine dehydrogenase family protein subunit M [Chloroflexi bacterium]|nr:xanthine dehydrogenase family protein subunit M [Chloroflexota bacterium]
MKPPSFDYYAPRTVDEALARLSEHGDAAKVLAGGQSLVPLLNFRLASPEVLVDVNRVGGLSDIAAWDGGLTIGAMARQSALEHSGLAATRLPLLVEAARLVGHPTVRHRGTVGGSLAHADPAAELPAAMLALDALLVARSVRGERTIPAAAFFAGYLTTALAPDELLTEIRVPGVPDGTGTAFVELSRREGDFAICGAAALVTLDRQGRCSRARVTLCGVGDGPVRAQAVEGTLQGETPRGAVLEAAARRVVDAIDPPSDVHGSAAYRRKMAVVMTRRALALAAERAGGNGQ